MPQTATATASKPVWVDLASKDPAAAREFYSKLFGWDVQVNPDPQYGGYGIAKVGDNDAAGIGGQMAPEAPTVWSLYIGSDDAEALAREVEAAGGKVIMPPFDVGDQGKMAVFQDPSGGFISTWQATQMRGFQTDAPNSFGWAELQARGVEKAIPFYQQVFGWETRRSPAGAGGADYIEFLHDGQSILGALEMPEQMPAQVPSHWLVYFYVEDVDAAAQKARSLGGSERIAPMDFPGGRFAIVADLDGASVGLLKMRPR
jgi:predicted enzyme related to lactoylglutathione lyase